MNRPRYESLDGARNALEARISHKVVDDAFAAVSTATRELIDDYELDDDVDVDEVVKWLKVSFCESAVLFFEEGIWEDEDDAERVVEDIQRDPVSNATTLVGGQVGRGRDMMVLSGAILKRQYTDR